MQANGIVTFTTDFGTSDSYVGVMKGIVLSANPHARLVDITHEIPAHDIVNASFLLGNTYSYFPAGTIHVVIVDPGVGGERKNICILTKHYYFIGPDNGTFSIVCSKENVVSIREIKSFPFVRKEISTTFHGRDVFAPCAGHLSMGKHFSAIGPPVKNIHYLEYPKCTIHQNTLTGEVVSIDSFGNMITNISEQMLRSFVEDREFEIYFASERFDKVQSHYAEVPSGKTLVIVGSSGYLEISMNGGNASSYFMTSVGSTIMIRRTQ